MDLREIDALVAEHLIGFRRIDVHEPGVHLTWRDDASSTAYTHENLPWFSSDAGAAWSVIEKLGGSLGKFGIGWEDGKVHEDIYEVRLPNPRWTKENLLPMITEYGSSWEQAWQRILVRWLELKGITVPTE